MPGLATNQNAILGELARGGCLTTAELVKATGIAPNKVADACGAVIRRGLIERIERGCFRVTPEGAAAAAAGVTIVSGPVGPLTSAVPRRPRRITGRDRLWHAIRTLRKFTLAELMEVSGASRDGAARYVWALTRAGYLTPLRREARFHVTSNGCCRWLLTDNTGAGTPTLNRAGSAIHDPNDGRTRPVERRGKPT